MALRARLVDPRDITVEPEPIYRVSFWSRDGSACRDFDVDAADAVDEVIDWADGEVQAHETYILGVRWTHDLVESDGTRDVVFLRLKGEPPPGQSVGARRGDDRR